MSLLHKKKHMVVMFCSPNEHKTTKMLLNAFIEPFMSNDEKWVIEEFNAYEMNARPCTACGECKEKEKCKFHDLDAWDKELRKSDLLVIASPVYNFSFPAPFKSILDRTQRYYEARFSLNIAAPLEKSREAVLLTTSGRNDTYGTEVMKNQLKQAFTIMNTQLVDTVSWYSTDNGQVGLGEASEKAKALALELIGKS